MVHINYKKITYIYLIKLKIKIYNGYNLLVIYIKSIKMVIRRYGIIIVIIKIRYGIIIIKIYSMLIMIKRYDLNLL